MNKEQLKEESKKITSIDLFITEECNMGCSYCFHKQSDNKLDLEGGKKILDRLHQLNPEKMSISFFGGEPLMYPELVYDLGVYARGLWKNLDLHITTNGLYFDDEMFKKYREIGCSIQISFDGDEDTQNACRGSFETVRDNIVKSLKYFPNLFVRMTYTPETVGQLAHNIQFIHSLGVKNIMHHATMEDNWDDEKLKEYMYQLKNVYNYRRFCMRRNIPLVIHFAEMPMKILNDESPTELEFCMAGKSYFGILPNGDMYPCHRAVSNRIFKLGNIFNERPVIRGIFAGLSKETTGCSRNCEAWRTCHSCPITHFLVNNDVKSPLIKNKYCDICRIEYNMAKSFLPIETADRQDRMLQKIASVIVDNSEAIEELRKEVFKKKDGD